MKKIIIFFLPLLFLGGCTDSKSDMPILEIVGIFIDGDEDEVNYARNYNRMPLLEKGDKINIFLKLYGNGNDLRTFIVQSDDMKSDIVDYNKEEVAPELSDITDGRLAFIDGIEETALSVKAEIMFNEKEEQTLNFFLFSKTFETEGADIHLTFNILP